MEKQLLNLLQWDLIVREDDLYTHLEPFLAPIRSWQTRQAEKAKQALLRERLLEEQRNLSERLRQRSIKNLSTFDSSRSYRSISSSHGPGQPISHAAAIPERTPSLSPPARSNSALSSSTLASYETSPSSVGSPSNDDAPVRIQRQGSSAYLDMNVHKLKSRQPSMDQLIMEPQKKLKTGNIFSRFIGGTAVTH